MAKRYGHDTTDWRRVAKSYKAHVRECHALMREELDGILASACPLIDGVPDRSRIDPQFIDIVERYEKLLAWKL